MNYNKYSLNAHSKKKATINATGYAFKEGVILTPQGKYIARVKDHRGYVTLSQHKTKKEAEKVYNQFYQSKN